MDRELFEREKQYRIAMSVAKSMLQNGLISDGDFAIIDTIMRDKFRSILSGLYPQNRLIQ